MKVENGKIPSFEDHFGLLIEQISIVVQKMILNDLKDKGVEINFNEFLMIQLLASHSEGLSQKQISEKLFKDKAMITRFTNHLENLKLVKRTQRKEDARSYIVSITKTGLKTIRSLEDLMIPFEKSFIKSIGRSDFLVFNSVLKKLLAHAVDKTRTPLA